MNRNVNDYLKNAEIMSTTYGGSLLPAPELKSKLESIKSFYHTFEYKSRIITLCISLNKNVLSKHSFTCGYSVCVPEDKFDKELGKKISFGRSQKNYLFEIAVYYNEYIMKDLAFLKGIAVSTEHAIKDNKYKLKGIV